MMHFSEQFKRMENLIRQLQDAICAGLEETDGKKFREDEWERPGGGGGHSRIIEDGQVIEKGGVNISVVYGNLPEELAAQFHTSVQQFAACGLSIVIHPHSPRIPTIHMNIRYFEMEKGHNWFGGGIDLTPYYPFPDDFRFFHQQLKNICEKTIPGSYRRFKKECDEYFTVHHRREMRGIGGIFYDYLDGNQPEHFQLSGELGRSFPDIYLPLVDRHRDESFTAADKQFQLVRRGRYVEFNLVYDRGTLFGLKSGGRIESILMSLPPQINFPYDWKPATGSPQAEMMQYYQPREWALDETER